LATKECGSHGDGFLTPSFDHTHEAPARFALAAFETVRRLQRRKALIHQSKKKKNRKRKETEEKNGMKEEGAIKWTTVSTEDR
jgi:hypothetical protein